MLEFAVPARTLPRAAWEACVRAGPAARRPRRLAGLGRGRRLPRAEHPRLLATRCPPDRLRGIWERPGSRDVAGAPAQPRRRRRHVGHAWRLRRAARRSTRSRPGGWRDYVTLLHPPYTAWHLSYVAIGAALTPAFAWDRFLPTLAAFFLARRDRRARARRAQRPAARDDGSRAACSSRSRSSRSPARSRSASSARSRSTPGSARSSPPARFIVVAYNLELAGGRFHGDPWFAPRLGRVPARSPRTSPSPESWTRSPRAGASSRSSSAAQRRLSTPVRDVRRRVARVDGDDRARDGTSSRSRPSSSSGARSARGSPSPARPSRSRVGLVIMRVT